MHFEQQNSKACSDFNVKFTYLVLKLAVSVGLILLTPTVEAGSHTQSCSSLTVIRIHHVSAQDKPN